MGQHAIVSPVPIQVVIDVPRPTIWTRSYLSSHLLWAARHAAAEAERIEDEHSGEPRFDIVHRGHVLTAVVLSAAFLEAMMNELFTDAVDRHILAGDGYVAPLSDETRAAMTSYWLDEDRPGERASILDEYHALAAQAGLDPVDKGREPYQSAVQVITLRNVVAHYKPETVSGAELHDLARALRRRFEDNALMAGSGNAWWPDHCLGAGCARWAHESVTAFADWFTAELGVRPNYQRVDFGERRRRVEPPDRAADGGLGRLVGGLRLAYRARRGWGTRR